MAQRKVQKPFFFVTKITNKLSSIYRLRQEFKVLFKMIAT
jgi:hypothetical protein